jgi:hypothetical protein
VLVNVVNATYAGGHRIEITFNDGRTGIVDLSEALAGPAFESLSDEDEFRRFSVSDELDTIVWENGADLAPEFLYFQAFKQDPGLQELFRNWGYLK